MNKKHEWAIDRLKKTMKPEVVEKISPLTMILFKDELKKMPKDWMEFVMLTVANNYDDESIVPCAGSLLVNLNDEATTRAFEIIKNSKLELLVAGLGDKTIIWNLWVYCHNEDGVLFAGGDHFREHCDLENIYYKSYISEDGIFMSCSDLKYQKKEGEDCRAISGDFRSQPLQ